LDISPGAEQSGPLPDVGYYSGSCKKCRSNFISLLLQQHLFQHRPFHQAWLMARQWAWLVFELLTPRLSSFPILHAFVSLATQSNTWHSTIITMRNTHCTILKSWNAPQPVPLGTSCVSCPLFHSVIPSFRASRLIVHRVSSRKLRHFTDPAHRPCCPAAACHFRSSDFASAFRCFSHAGTSS
jgi:hypothetical protein